MIYAENAVSRYANDQMQFLSPTIFKSLSNFLNLARLRCLKARVYFSFHVLLRLVLSRVHTAFKVYSTADEGGWMNCITS